MPYRIDNKAYVDFTGELGQVEFKDGVTVGSPPQLFLDRLAASFGLVDAETGAPAGLIARMAEITAVPFVAPPALDRMSPEQILAANAAAVSSVAKTLRPASVYTQAELEAVAEKDGIAGLRAIAGPYGVKGKAIPTLIAAILVAQETVADAQKPVVFQLSQAAKEAEAEAAAAAARASAAEALRAAEGEAADAEEKARVAEAAAKEAEARLAAAQAGASPAVQVAGQA